MALRQRGAKLSSFDGRDFVFQPRAMGIEDQPVAHIGQLPELPWPPWNQGNAPVVPCCVSIAVVTAMELLDTRDSNPERLSVLFHYYMARQRESRLGGLETRAGLDSAVTRGVCTLPLHQPQPPTEVISREAALRAPSPQAEEDAKHHALEGLDIRRRRRRYWQLSEPRRIEDWRAALNSGYPLICVFPVTEGYVRIGPDNPVHGDVRGDPVGANLHAVVAIAFDDDRQAIRMRDSNGPDSADHGHWWMPYSLVRSPWFIKEVWTITSIKY